jgi:hypothetical protein
MSKSPAFGEGAKGHRGRLTATLELPVHQEGRNIPFCHDKTNQLLCGDNLVALATFVRCSA